MSNKAMGNHPDQPGDWYTGTEVRVSRVGAGKGGQCSLGSWRALGGARSPQKEAFAGPREGVLEKPGQKLVVFKLVGSKGGF